MFLLERNKPRWKSGDWNSFQRLVKKVIQNGQTISRLVGLLVDCYQTTSQLSKLLAVIYVTLSNMTSAAPLKGKKGKEGAAEVIFERVTKVITKVNTFWVQIRSKKML